MTRLATVALALALVLGVGCSDDDKPVPDSALPDSTVDSTVDSGVDVMAPDSGDGAVGDVGPDGPVGPTEKLVILHTNDLHAHLMGWPNADYTPASTGDGTTGGFARLAAKIKSERSAAGTTPVLLLDDGDYVMGSLFSWLDTTKAPEMALLQSMGFDATTLGNHDFEWTIKPLAAFLAAGVAAGFKVPIVQSNIVFDATDPADDAVEAFTKNGVIVKKLVKTLSNGLKVGIFGVMGKASAILSAPGAPVTFEDYIAAAKKMITELRDQDKVDLVICLSHSGLNHDMITGEDVDLADKAPGIDVIISGHTHTELPQPLKQGDTLIVNTGEHAEHLGKLELEISGGTVAKSTYTLIPIDDTIQGDSATQQLIDGYIQDIDALLQPFGLAYNKVIAETSFDLTFPDFQETLLGNLVTDAYLNIYNALNPTAPADASIEAGGIIKDPIEKGKTGKIWFADAYRALPNSIGPDQVPGTPLLAMYLNGKDLKTAGEVMAMAQGLLDSQVFYLQFSGMQVEYQKSGLPTAAVTSIKIGNPLQAVDFTDTTKCYKIVTNLYIAEMLAQVSTVTGGLLSVQAKESDCQTVVTDPTAHLVDADPTTPGVQELKVWAALVKYISSFPDTNSNSIPDIPSAYSQLQNRIIIK